MSNSSDDRPMEKPTIFVTMSLSFAIRNFFETGIIDELGRYYTVVLLAIPSIAATLRKLNYDRRAELIVLDVGREPLLWHALRLFKKKTYMEGRDSSTEAILERYFPRPLYKKIGGMAAKAVVRWADPIKLFYVLERVELALTRDRTLRRLFAERKPRFVFFTHTSLHHEEVIFRNCRAEKVPTIYMILSWDHLSAKVTVHPTFDKVLVWNEHTRLETLRTYPRTNPKSVTVVGIPQYDLYAQQPSLDYTAWCRRYGLDPSKKTILFSTMPQQRHDQQHLILQELLKEIVKGEKVPRGYQLLIKCHPFDNFSGYEEIIRGFPAALHGTAFGETRDQKGWQPTGGEIEASRDALFFCSMNINIFSTVTIEAAFFDKPIVHIAFDPEPPLNRIPCHEYYNWDHFKHIVEKNATIMARSFSELYEAISQYTRSPEYKRAERRTVVETYIGNSIGNASGNVVAELIAFGDSIEVGRKDHS
jgi:hypothetical protein